MASLSLHFTFQNVIVRDVSKKCNVYQITKDAGVPIGKQEKKLMVKLSLEIQFVSKVSFNQFLLVK